jgi:hypothetical protein
MPRILAHVRTLNLLTRGSTLWRMLHALQTTAGETLVRLVVCNLCVCTHWKWRVHQLRHEQAPLDWKHISEQPAGKTCALTIQKACARTNPYHDMLRANHPTRYLSRGCDACRTCSTVRTNVEGSYAVNTTSVRLLTVKSRLHVEIYA